MLPRLWRCADPSWWEFWTSAPLSTLGLALLTFVSALLLLAEHRRAEHVLVLICNLVVSAIGLAALGLMGGLGLRLCGLDPSWLYNAAKTLWLFGGWPLLLLHIWRIWPVQPPPQQRILRRLILGVVALATVAILVVSLALNSAQGVFATLIRVSVMYPLDSVTPFVTTDECLAVHRLEYLSRHEHPPVDLARLPGELADAELAARGTQVDRAVCARALHSYRTRVLRGELPDPETLDVAACKDCPGVEAELRAWTADPSHTQGSRELAHNALGLMLYAPTSIAPSHHEQRKLRPPARSP